VFSRDKKPKLPRTSPREIGDQRELGKLVYNAGEFMMESILVCSFPYNRKVEVLRRRYLGNNIARL
jgi:hypothetical protein